MSKNDVHMRRTILKFIVFLIFGVIACRIGYIQLIDTKYKNMAAGNVLRYEVQYAPRGEVVDRNGEFLVQSMECYDLMVTYNDLEVEGFDTMLVCELVGIEKESLTRALNKIKKDTYRRMRPDVVASYDDRGIVARVDGLGGIDDVTEQTCPRQPYRWQPAGKHQHAA